MKRPLIVAGVTAVAVAAPLVANGKSSSLQPSARGTKGPAVVIDPLRGRAGGVLIGTPVKTITAFGARRPNRDPATEEWWGLGSPGTYHYPTRCTGPTPATGKTSRRVFERTFTGAEVSFCGDRPFLLTVTARGSRTTKDARIGQPLDAAAARHPGLKCDVSTANTTDPSVPVYRYCTGRIASGRYLWLGQDPVSSIAIASVPLA